MYTHLYNLMHTYINTHIHVCVEREEKDRETEKKREYMECLHMCMSVMCEPGAPEVRRRRFIAGSWDYR